MGWLWATPAPARPAQQAPAHAPAAPSQPQPPANDLDEDPSVREFLAFIQSEVSGNKPADRKPPPPATQQPSSQPPPPPPPSQSKSSWSWFAHSSAPTTTTAPTPEQSSTSSPTSAAARTADQPDSFDFNWDDDSSPSPDTPSLSPLAESLLPTTMDCTQAFNHAFYCQSLGGQWNAIYRSGGMRSCSEQWEDFFFCMRVKTLTGDAKANMIREHYRKKELAKYGSGKASSEDVWEERREKVPPGTAFREVVERPDVSDADFQRAEMDRLRKIREGLQ